MLELSTSILIVKIEFSLIADSEDEICKNDAVGLDRKKATAASMCLDSIWKGVRGRDSARSLLLLWFIN